jgi:threonine/homoserine/homoserine lactone efflux protein
MGNVIGELFPLVVALATGPLPVIALMLILASEGATAKGLAFVAGRMTGLAVLAVGALVIASAVGHPDLGHRAHPSPVVSIVRIVLGVLLLGLAVRMWRRRSATADGGPSRLARQIDGITTPRSFGLGLAVTAIDPASLSIGVLVGVDVAAGRLSTPADIVVVIAFLLMATVNITVPMLAYLVGGDAARRKLSALKEWLQTNEKTVMMVLFLMIGAILIGRGIRDLVG